MFCPYCNKDIYGMTGLQELQKFEKHLRKCKKNPERQLVVSEEGNIVLKSQTMREALDLRAESGQ